MTAISPYLRKQPPDPSSEDGWNDIAWRCLGVLDTFADRANARATGVYLQRSQAYAGLAQTLVSYPDGQAAADAMQKLRSTLKDCRSDKGEATVGSEDTYEATAQMVQPAASVADDELDVTMSIAQRDYGTLKIIGRSHGQIVFARAANHIIRLQTDVGPEGRRKQLLAVVVPEALRRLAAVARGDPPDDDPIQLPGWR